MNAYRIAVIGDRESVMGFRALGLDVYPAEPDTAEAAFDAAMAAEGQPYAIIYITEELIRPLQSRISEVKEAMVPAVIPIPSRNGTLGLGMNALTSAVERAVGANIL
jgi:V/A-type H+-transporting ATPase subunit F